MFVLRFYSIANPLGSSRAWSVYLTTFFLGRHKKTKRALPWEKSVYRKYVNSKDPDQWAKLLNLKGAFFLYICVVIFYSVLGWLGEAKVSCILHHRGVQLILAFNCARRATLAAGGGRGRMFLLLLFLHFHSFSSFSHVPLFHLIYYLPSPFLWMTTKWPTRVDVSLNPNTVNQSTVCNDSVSGQ